jgi:hypothetical protein
MGEVFLTRSLGTSFASWLPRKPFLLSRGSCYLARVTWIFSARIVDGVISVPDLELAEGAEVTVCLSDELPVSVSADEEERLLSSIAQADRGLGSPAAEVMTAFRRR